MATTEDWGCANALARPSMRCGFEIGPPRIEPCVLMRAIAGMDDTDYTHHCHWAKLPSVQKWSERLDSCGKKATKNDYCTKGNTKWVWEAYCFKRWANYTEFFNAHSPMVIAFAIGADGLVYVDTKTTQTPPTLCRHRHYNSRRIAGTGQWSNYDIFEKNQYSSKVQSWGPNGSLLPQSNSSDAWVSLVDEEGMGIIMFYDELYIGNTWYIKDSGGDRAQLFYEILFRPRPIVANDLIFKMVNRQCNLPCDRDPDLLTWPCLSNKKCFGEADSSGNIKGFLPAVEDIKDTDTIYFYDGKTMKGDEFKKKPEKQKDYKPPCINVCNPAELTKRDIIRKVCTEYYQFYITNNRIEQHSEVLIQLRGDLEKINEILDNPNDNYLSKIQLYIREKRPRVPKEVFRKLSVFYCKLFQCLWEIRMEKYKSETDPPFWKDENILDKFILCYELYDKLNLTYYYP